MDFPLRETEHPLFPDRSQDNLFSLANYGAWALAVLRAHFGFKTHSLPLFAPPR